MSATKQMKRAVKGMTDEQLVDIQVHLKDLITNEKNNMRRSSLNEQLEIAQQEVKKRETK